jgi:hypothetical protein
MLTGILIGLAFAWLIQDAIHDTIYTSSENLPDDDYQGTLV